jgi:hypothetical protein
MNRLGTAFWPGPRGSWQRCLAFSVASLLCCFLGLSTRAAESEARQVTPPPALKGRCPTATGSLRHHGLREGSARWKETRLIQLNSAPGTNSAHTIWDTALYDPDQGVVQTALNVFGNRAIPRELSVEEFIWIQSRVATAPSGEATAWAYALANSGLATNALIISVIAERYVADVRSPPPKAGNVGGGGAYLKGEAFFYTQWLRVFRLADQALSRRILNVLYRRTTEPRVRFWLDLARGVTGDEEVGERLLKVVEDEGLDVSLRAVALRAYAGAMKGAAVPVLEKFKAERGQATANCQGSVFPMAVVAQSELYRLRQGSWEEPASGAVLRWSQSLQATTPNP